MFTLVALATLAICTSYGQNIIVDTILGDVIGQQRNEYVFFHGIPYTEDAPIGNRRFMESAVRTSDFLTQPYPAINYSSSCIQEISSLQASLVTHILLLFFSEPCGIFILLFFAFCTM